MSLDWLPVALSLLAAMLGIYGLICIGQAVWGRWERKHAPPVHIVDRAAAHPLPPMSARRVNEIWIASVRPGLDKIIEEETDE